MSENTIRKITRGYKNIFLSGFRASGKTTFGKMAAEKLNWKFYDMDDLIEERAGKSISQITQNGKNWQSFRQMELDLLKEFLEKEKAIIALGGGAGVNNIVQTSSGKFFGEIERELLKAKKDSLTILLTASDKIIADRIKEQEMEKQDIKRPILDEEKAKKVQELLEKYEDNPEKQKEIMIDELVKDSLKMFASRKELYENLADKKIDTSDDDFERISKEIVSFVL